MTSNHEAAKKRLADAANRAHRAGGPGRRIMVYCGDILEALGLLETPEPAPPAPSYSPPESPPSPPDEGEPPASSPVVTSPEPSGPLPSVASEPEAPAPAYTGTDATRVEFLDIPDSLADLLAENGLGTVGAVKAFGDLTRVKGLGATKAKAVAEAIAKVEAEHASAGEPVTA